MYFSKFFCFIMKIIHLAEAVEYANYISAER